MTPLIDLKEALKNSKSNGSLLVRLRKGSLRQRLRRCIKTLVTYISTGKLQKQLGTVILLFLVSHQSASLLKQYALFLLNSATYKALFTIVSFEKCEICTSFWFWHKNSVKWWDGDGQIILLKFTCSYLMENCSDTALNCNRLGVWWLPNRNKTTGPLAMPWQTTLEVNGWSSFAKKMRFVALVEYQENRNTSWDGMAKHIGLLLDIDQALKWND